MRSALKKLGRRKAGTYGRTHGPSRGNSKRVANKAVRKIDPRTSHEDIEGISNKWLPVRRGNVYCSLNACGRGCTWDEYQAAVKESKRIAKVLGAGWKPSVHENLGWFPRANNAKMNMQVSKGFGSYMASVGDQGILGSGATPLAAVEDARNATRIKLSKWAALAIMITA